MPNGSPGWKVERFIGHFEEWAEREQIGIDGRCLVLAWIMSRADDPYLDVERETLQDNLWYGRIPDAEDVVGHVVTGSYFIFDQRRIVRGNSFRSWPPP